MPTDYALEKGWNLKKKQFPEVSQSTIAWPLLRKQNIQAKEDYCQSNMSCLKKEICKWFLLVWEQQSTSNWIWRDLRLKFDQTYWLDNLISLCEF